MVLLATVWLAAAVTIVSASTSRPTWTRDLVKKSTLSAIPRGWEMVDTPIPEHHTVTLQIGVKQDRFSTLR